MHFRACFHAARVFVIALAAMALVLARLGMPEPATAAFADIGSIRVPICSAAGGGAVPADHGETTQACDHCLACTPAGLLPPVLAAIAALPAAAAILRPGSATAMPRLAEHARQPIRGPPAFG